MALRTERSDHTLQPTALVHEVYLRLREQRRLPLDNRDAFFALAARIVRRILVDHARRKALARSDGVKERLLVAGQAETSLVDRRPLEILALNESLEKLGELDRRLVRVVELRFFGGLTVAESAAALRISERSAADDWSLARAWLRRRLHGEDAER